MSWHSWRHPDTELVEKFNQPEVQLARKSLACLRLEVAGVIADDVKQKVESAFSALARPSASNDLSVFLAGLSVGLALMTFVALLVL